MIQNWYTQADAEKWMAQASDRTADRELALRVYTSQLIGQNPDLVMHGGGNTSIKITRQNLLGEIEEVLHIKGSGWDLDTILASGLPGVRLDALRLLRSLRVPFLCPEPQTGFIKGF